MISISISMNNIASNNNVYDSRKNGVYDFRNNNVYDFRTISPREGIIIKEAANLSYRLLL